jgi:adenylyl-sulfate kinase
VLWLTGLSGSGKSTIAAALEAALVASGHLAYVLDGDNLRHGLNSDLGFAPAARAENIRRVGEVAALFADAGVLTLTSFISPYRADREAARSAVGAERFLEVFVDAPLALCEQRDPKQLYRRARAGEIADFTGVTAPYEPPERPDLTLDTATLDPAACVASLLALLERRGFLPAAGAPPAGASGDPRA